MKKKTTYMEKYININSDKAQQNTACVILRKRGCCNIVAAHFSRITQAVVNTITGWVDVWSSSGIII